MQHNINENNYIDYYIRCQREYQVSNTSGMLEISFGNYQVSNAQGILPLKKKKKDEKNTQGILEISQFSFVGIKLTNLVT